MGYRVRFGPDGLEYDTLKHLLVVDESLDSRDSATFSAKHVDTIAGMMPIQVVCNTVSSPTFGGTVRGWTTRYVRAGQSVTHDIDVDDWRPYLDRFRPRVAYSSVAIHSIVGNLLTGHVAGISAAGVHSMVSEAGSITWSRVTVEYTARDAPSAIFDSLVAMQTAPDATNPPAWRITADKVMHLVGAASSIGPTVTIDDTDLDLQRFEISELGTKGVTQINVWGGHAQTVYTCITGQNSISVYQWDRFQGPPDHWTVGGTNEVYLYYNGQYTPVLDVNSSTGTVMIHSLNTDGVAHAGIANGSSIRAFSVHGAPATSMAVCSAVTGEVYHFQDSRDVYDEGWSLIPQTYAANVQSLLRLPTHEVTLLRVVTTNSQATPGGTLAVSLTAPASAQGLYTIRRVRISGFDRGETIRPIYEIEAGPLARYRIDSLL